MLHFQFLVNRSAMYERKAQQNRLLHTRYLTRKPSLTLSCILIATIRYFITPICCKSYAYLKGRQCVSCGKLIYFVPLSDIGTLLYNVKLLRFSAYYFSIKSSISLSLRAKKYIYLFCYFIMEYVYVGLFTSHGYPIAIINDPKYKINAIRKADAAPIRI